MKYWQWVLVMTVVLAPPAAAQILDFYGYTYSDETGDLTLAGAVDGFFAPMTSTPGFEYSMYLSELRVDFVENQGGGWVRTVFSGGTFMIYEDAAPDIDYGINPPNATVPSTFVNGTLYLSGDFFDFESYRNAAFGIGSFQGNVTFTGGSHLGEMSLFVEGWTFGGTTTFPQNLPEGYAETWDGMLYRNPPTSTLESSWSEVKQLFR